MGVKVFGRREGVPYGVNAAGGIQDQVFCMIDSSTNDDRKIKPATTGATVFDGVVGVVQTGIWHGKYGTATSLYPTGADVNVVSNGQVRVKLHDPDNVEGMEDGNLVAISDGGDGTIVKYTAPSITPTMTALLGETAIGTVISGATATFSTPPTGAEIAAYLTEVLPKYAGLNSTAIKAYIAEYVADYVSAYIAVLNGAVGRCVGDPVGGVACIELIGLGGIQQG